MNARLVAGTRVGIGLMQGLILYILYETTVRKWWPATDPIVFSPLLLTAVFVPLIALVGLSRLRWRTLAICLACGAVLCAGLGVYDIYRDAVTATGEVRPIPLPESWVALTATLFILHHLVVAGDNERRLIASYPTYFDISWMLAVQAALTAFFVAAFWGLLWLGAGLFRLIQIPFLFTLIQHSWFWIPVTTVAVASGLHVTDAHAGLVRGARTLALTVLSWLLPILTLLAAAFVLALPFTGLDPLWNTRSATPLLLTAAGALVLLINAAYQDGAPELAVPAVIRHARLVAALVLVPLVALAGYGLMLRIQQYGWTPQRITALAFFAVMACYALGYGLAVVSSGPALRLLPITNVATACVIVAVLIALFSPLADPARISVADQVARLRDGRTPIGKFDFRFLRFDGGRFGREELSKLASESGTPQAASIAQRATQALAMQSRYGTPAVAMTAQNRAANITVIQPAGQSLPESFVQQEWSSVPGQPFVLPYCLTSITNKCDALLVDLDGDGRDEILLLNGTGGTGTAFASEEDGKTWKPLGLLLNGQCRGVRDALRAGEFAVVGNPLKDLKVAGHTLRVSVTCAPESAR